MTVDVKKHLCPFYSLKSQIYLKIKNRNMRNQRVKNTMNNIDGKISVKKEGGSIAGQWPLEPKIIH